MRNFLKHTVSSATFIAGLCVLLLLASQIVMPKNNRKDDGMQDTMANGILSEPENSIDVLILGDSDAYSSIIPLQMWRDHGITSYCCGTSGQTLCYTVDFLHKSFRRQRPKIVILETDTIFRNFSYGDSIIHKVNRTFPVFVYHNRWKSLKAKDWSFSVNYTYVENSKGYFFNTAIAEANDKNYMKPSDDFAPISLQNREYIEDIHSFCEDNKAKFVFVSAPSTVNWNSMRHNSTKKLAEELNVDYIDTNMLRDDIPIDWKADTRDKGDHLNYSGAVKVTNYLGKYLSDSGLLTDHRDDERYNYWNTELDNFNKILSSSQKQ